MYLRIAWIGIGRLWRVPRNDASRQIAGGRDARVAAKGAVVDLVSDHSEMEGDDRACSSATGIDGTEESERQEQKRRGGRCSRSRAVRRHGRWR